MRGRGGGLVSPGRDAALRRRILPLAGPTHRRPAMLCSPVGPSAPSCVGGDCCHGPPLCPPLQPYRQIGQRSCTACGVFVCWYRLQRFFHVLSSSEEEEGQIRPGQPDPLDGLDQLAPEVTVDDAFMMVLEDFSGNFYGKE